MSIPLPFLEEKNNQSGVATEVMGSDPGMVAAAQDVLSAISANDPKALASALANAVELCGSLPPSGVPDAG